MGSGDHQKSAERDVLADHHAQLGDLFIAEMLAELGSEGGIYGAEIGGELLREADCQGLAGR